MFLIVWLWNPWKDYKLTRHNLGFLFIDYFQQQNNFSEFKSETKFKGEISTGIIGNQKVILLKPSTFMNLSGQSVKLVSDFYKISQENIIIIYDDISMDFWKIRVRTNWSAGWHNGIKSIIDHFGENFTRIKYWIGLDQKFDVSNWVLSKFTKEEIKELEENWFEKLEKELLKIISQQKK